MICSQGGCKSFCCHFLVFTTDIKIINYYIVIKSFVLVLFIGDKAEENVAEIQKEIVS